MFGCPVRSGLLQLWQRRSQEQFIVQPLVRTLQWQQLVLGQLLEPPSSSACPTSSTTMAKISPCFAPSACS